MKFNKLMISVLAILGLAASVAQARPHRHHGPRVSFGFNFGRPMAYRPVYAAPVVYTPYVRPSLGVSFGSGPVSFGFGFLR